MLLLTKHEISTALSSILKIVENIYSNAVLYEPPHLSGIPFIVNAIYTVSIIFIQLNLSNLSNLYKK